MLWSEITSGKFEKARAKAKGLGMVVESETLTPSGMAEATACMAYLKSLES